MNDPLAEFRSPLQTIADIHERVKHSERIKRGLIEVKVGDWKALYRSREDETYWAEEFPFGEMHGGGPSCFFMIEEDDPVSAFDRPEHFTSSIIKESERMKFWDALGEDEGDQICKTEGCSEMNTKYSVLCRRHHYENIRKEPCPF
jgi:hypothetical protein